MPQDKSAGALTQQRMMRQLFSGWAIARQDAQLGIKTPPQIQGGNVYKNAQSAVINVTEGATLTTPAELASQLGNTGPVVIVDPPTEPLNPSAVVTGGGQVTVSFDVPTSDGGGAITGYTVTSSPGGITATAASSPVVVNGLTNGTEYTFTVVATNSAGNSPASVPSNAVTPLTFPGPCTNVTAVAGVQSASISFTPPTSDGGSPITNQQVATWTPTAFQFSNTGASSPITIAGLTTGVAQTFIVIAVNALGNSPFSDPSNSVTAA